jgi:hypothetical protein
VHVVQQRRELRDEEAYCATYGLSGEQRRAIADRDVLELVRLGGNIYYLAKFAGIFGLSVRDVGAQQTGKSVEEFKATLVAAGEWLTSPCRTRRPACSCSRTPCSSSPDHMGRLTWNC